MKVSQVKKILQENQTWAKKAYGQHFLVDESVLDKIITAAEIKSTDRIIEVGPGFGVLTERLVRVAGEVVAIEADKEMVELFNSFIASRPENNDSMKQYNNLVLIEGDAIKVLDSLEFKEKYLKEPLNPSVVGTSTQKDIKKGQYKVNEGYKVVANIPYSITSILIKSFLENDYPPESMTLLVQKEVAERIVAKPGEMSLLSLSVQYFSCPQIISHVSKLAFWPVPKVESSIIQIKSKVTDVKERKRFFRLARIGFSSRRKTLVNNLSAGFQLDRGKVTAIIKKTGLDEKVRAQELSIDNWQNLTVNFSHLIK